MFEDTTIEVNGAKLRITRAGNGRPLVLLHGWPEYRLTWRPVMERLAERFALIAPDLRGFGDSDKPSGNFGPNEQAADIAALIESLATGPVGLISHDVGATVAQALARTRPDLLSGLFFFNFMYPGIGARYNTAAHLRYVWQTYFNQDELAPKLLRSAPDGVRMFVTHFIRLWAHHPQAFDETTLDALVANMEKPGNLEGGFTWYRSVGEQRAREAKSVALPAPIALPTCVRWTENDKALDIAWTDRLPEFFSDLDFESFPEAGHFPHHEQPDRAATEIERFFTRLSAQGWKT